MRGSFINNPAAGEATVTGTPQVNETLTADTSGISDDDGLTNVSYNYQWIAGGLDIAGATGSSYTLTSNEQGKRIKVRVAFVDDRGNFETLTSEATPPVKAADRPGTVSLFPARPRVGTVVSAALSDPDGLEGGGSGPAASSGAVSWSWARSSDGTAWTGVEAYDDGDSYVPTEDDEGMLLKAEASYTDGQGPGKSAEAVSPAVVGAREPGPELMVTEIVTGLSHPWGIDFTPDGTMLFTQRAGVLNARLTDGTVKRVDADLGDLLVDGFAGLQALAVDPDFTTNRRFYTLQGHAGREMQVIAWTIDADYDEATRVVDPLVEGIPVGPGPWHSGGRLVFGPEGYLWIATGDGRVVRGAQDLTSLGGKVLRVDPRTGAGAPGNPFGASSPVYAYGFRNPQGLALRPGTDQMWLVEHGPKHDDEINLLAPGRQLRLGPGPGRRHVGLLRLFRRGRRPHDRPGEVPICPPGQMVLGIPHPGNQRGRFPGWPPMGGVGRATRGGHAQDEVASCLRVHRTGRFRGSDRRSGARRQPGPAADPGARPRRGSVHRHLQQTRR